MYVCTYIFNYVSVCVCVHRYLSPSHSPPWTPRKTKGKSNRGVKRSLPPPVELTSEEVIRLKQVSSEEVVRLKQVSSEEIIRLKQVSSEEVIRLKQVRITTTSSRQGISLDKLKLFRVLINSSFG